MPYRPPKGVRPPQLEGKRTGRPKGSRKDAKFWADVVWGFEHRHLDYAEDCPNRSAWIWWVFAHYYPRQVSRFLRAYGWI